MNEYIKKSQYNEITRLKLGRNEHVITKKDLFFDNGCCVQLLKEHPMKVVYKEDALFLDVGHLESLKKFGSIEMVDHEYAQLGHRVWRIVSPEERFLVMGYASEQEVESKKGTFLGGEGYYANAKALAERATNLFHKIKIFDSDLDEIALK